MSDLRALNSPYGNPGQPIRSHEDWWAAREHPFLAKSEAEPGLCALCECYSAHDAGSDASVWACPEVCTCDDGPVEMCAVHGICHAR